MLVPQLAKSTEVTSLEHFINDDSWVMEQKLDGNRIMLVSPGADMAPTCITRNGNIYSKKVPAAISNFRFPDGKWVLDGELVGDKYWVFDLPTAPGLVGELATLPSPLYVRRAMLEAFLANVPHQFGLTPQAKTRDEKIRLADHALKHGLEGLLLKKADSPYRPGGRTPEWLKLKFVSTADCIVLDVRDDGKDSVRLGLVDTDGVTIVDVGRASLIGKEKNGQIIPGDVIEVRYLYTGAGGRLYQPTILRLRDDKSVPECTVDQLRHVNKSVLESL